MILPWFFLRSHLSLAFKVNENVADDHGDFGNRFGAGFNAELEVGWILGDGLDENDKQQSFKTLIRRLDHRHLGLDAPELEISTPETLLIFCAKELKADIVRLKRGADISYEFKVRKD